MQNVKLSLSHFPPDFIYYEGNWIEWSFIEVSSQTFTVLHNTFWKWTWIISKVLSTTNKLSYRPHNLLLCGMQTADNHKDWYGPTNSNV